MIVIAIAVLFLVFFCVGASVLFFTRKQVARIGNGATRQLLRALIVALAFTPTVVPVPSLHGALPVPASWALLCGLSGDTSSGEPIVAITHGGIPLAVVFAATWLVAFFISCARRNPPAAS